LLKYDSSQSFRPIFALCSAAATSASGRSLKRAIQFAPPGPVTWL